MLISKNIVTYNQTQTEWVLKLIFQVPRLNQVKQALEIMYDITIIFVIFIMYMHKPCNHEYMMTYI
jgi:hypothetical protein